MERGGPVKCPWCGNIQDELGRCIKCGKDRTPSTVTSRDDARGAPPAGQVPVATAKTLRPEPEELWAEPSDSGDEPDRAFTETHTPTGTDVPGKGPLVPVYLPVAKFATLTVITLSFYQIVWFYRNWRILKRYHDRWLDPARLTLLMLIPVYGIYVAYRQLKALREMVGLRVKAFPVIPVFIGWVILFGWMLPAARLEMGFLLFFVWLGSGFVLIPVQMALNRYARSIGEGINGFRTRKAWTAAAVLLVVFCLLAGIADLAIRHR